MADRIIAEGYGGAKWGTHHSIQPPPCSLIRLAGKAITYHFMRQIEELMGRTGILTKILLKGVTT